MAVNNIIKGRVDKWLINAPRQRRFSGCCYLCGDFIDGENFLLCSACINGLPENTPACSACAMPVTAGDYCAQCLQVINPRINFSFCAFRYQYPVNRIIQDFKYHSRLEISRFLGSALVKQVIENEFQNPDGLVPVPLHHARLRQRGYNQALEISQNVSRILNIPIINTGIRRIRKTSPQSELTAKQRKQNIRGSFASCPASLAGLNHVVIIDDVITTGATVNEVARVMKIAGIARVDVWACARAII